MGNILSTAGALASDVLAAVQLPGGSIVSKLVDSYVERRQQAAARILTEELKSGYHGEVAFEEHDLDPLIGIIFQMQSAMDHGIGMENLRLLSQIIAGMKKNKALNGDRFRKWCSIVEPLTRDELMVIGLACGIKKRNVSRSEPVDFWGSLQHQLKGAGYAETDIHPLCAMVARTGLLVPASAFGGMAYLGAEWLLELEQLIDAAGLTADIKAKRAGL